MRRGGMRGAAFVPGEACLAWGVGRLCVTSQKRRPFVPQDKRAAALHIDRASLDWLAYCAIYFWRDLLGLGAIVPGEACLAYLNRAGLSLVTAAASRRTPWWRSDYRA